MADISHEKDSHNMIKQLEKICTKAEIEDIKNSWLELKTQGMLNESMISSITDHYLLCALGKFDIIVGNPPWVDWKSLPSVHREKIKNACISRKQQWANGFTN